MKTKVVLDSGAFSAWTRGVTVDIDAYAAFIKEHIEYVDHYVNLDVIPGEFGRVPSPEEVEASASKSWDNLTFLEELSLRPMPVFHQGEQFKWLKRMIDHGCSYVGISPANDRTTDQKREWLDQVYDLICDEEGWPVVKTHGFGVTSIPLLFRYPWFSADSTSWKMFGIYGHILVPQIVSGEYVYDRSPNIVTVSSKQKRALEEGDHFLSYTEAEQDVVLKYIQFRGLTFHGVHHDQKQRDRINAAFFHDVTLNYTPRPFVRRKQRLF